MNGWQRWIDQFDPDVPPLDLDLRDLCVDPMLLSATREEWNAMERAALCAHSGASMAAARERATAGYPGLDDKQRSYWPHDNDPED